MRNLRWILLALLACEGTVWLSALMSNPTLVDPGQQKMQVRNYRAVAQSVDEGRLRGTIGELSSLGSRVTGYPGARKAANWVAAAFISFSTASQRAFDRAFSLSAFQSP